MHTDIMNQSLVVGLPSPNGALPIHVPRFCNVELPLLHSPGVWDVSNSRSFVSYAVPRLLLQLSAIFILTQSLHFLLKRLHLSRMVSEMLAGIILGPSVLGAIIPNFTAALFPKEGDVYLNVLYKMGFIFFMFLLGVKMEPSMVLKSGRKVWSMGATSVIIPIIIGLTVSPFLDRFIGFSTLPGIKYAISTQTLTPFPVVACLLIDLKIMNTELGRLSLATALVREILSVSIHTPLNYRRIQTQGSSILTALLTLFLFTAFVSSIVFGVRPLLLRIIKHTPEGRPVKGIYISLISSAVVASAIVSDALGLQYHVGPLILGLTVPVGPPLGSTLVCRLDTFMSSFLAPLLLSYCGIRTNMWEVYNLETVYILWGVFFFGNLIKIFSIFIPALTWKVSLKDAATLSLILSTQGIVELAGFITYLQNQTLNPESFTVVTLSVLVSGMTIPVAVRWLYDYSRTYIGYQKRNIEHASDSGELRVLACIHRQDEVLGILKQLEVSNPTKESPITVYPLHLVELAGQAAPLLINHNFGQKASSAATASRSQQIIDVFTYYEQQASGVLSVQAFTAVSLPKFMHDDICSLAFDKMASLIILPFHRKWNSQGKLIFDSTVVRSINQQVLDKSPCSVAILVDRRKMVRTPPAPSTMYRAAVIFLGGHDDREALAYAKRMARSSELQLTVFRLTPPEHMVEKKWDSVLDAEMLKDMRVESTLRDNVVYRDEIVSDGPETAKMIRSLDHDFDLIMVGRRHSLDSPMLSGLVEWTDLPELGPIGDLLASYDINRPASVLVLQQQYMENM